MPARSSSACCHGQLRMRVRLYLGSATHQLAQAASGSGLQHNPQARKTQSCSLLSFFKPDNLNTTLHIKPIYPAVHGHALHPGTSSRGAQLLRPSQGSLSNPPGHSTPPREQAPGSSAEQEGTSCQQGAQSIPALPRAQLTWTDSSPPGLHKAPQGRAPTGSLGLQIYAKAALGSPASRGSTRIPERSTS